MLYWPPPDLRLEKHFYWVGCQQAVKDLIPNCTHCIAAKAPARSRGQLQQYNSGTFQADSDVRSSNWPEVYTIPNPEANTVVNVSANNWVCLSGAPIELHSDKAETSSQPGKTFSSSFIGLLTMRYKRQDRADNGIQKEFSQSRAKRIIVVWRSPY